MVSCNLVAEFIKNKTKLVNVLTLVNLNVSMFRWSCSLDKVGFDFRCHISLGTCNWREMWISSIVRDLGRCTLVEAPKWDTLHPVKVLGVHFLASRSEHSSQTKVSNLGNISLANLIDENIFWLQISMEHIIFVDLCNTVDHMFEDFQVLRPIDYTSFVYIGRFTLTISLIKEVF